MTDNSHKWLWFLVLIIFVGVIIFMMTRPSPTTCDYGGKHYNVGDSFTAMDGCNTCFCGDGAAGEGIVGCTLMACPPTREDK